MGTRVRKHPVTEIAELGWWWFQHDMLARFRCLMFRHSEPYGGMCCWCAKEISKED